MALTPVELRHIRLRRGFLGYRRAAVEGLIDEVADSFEDVWRGRADLADQVERLEADLVRYRELEILLRQTLVSAERTAAELRDQAQREADVIIAEAQAEARAITRRAVAERERLECSSTRVRALLRAALDTLEPQQEADSLPEVEAA
jgi:cell division initiation protein